MNMRKLVVIIYSLVLLFAGCDDLEDKPYTTGEANGVVEDYGTVEMYILNEGLFNLNNSTLARYSFLTNSCSYDYFRALNHRGLGDTANDMDIYGSKLYVVVNVSSTVEVIDLQSGLSVKQIPMLTDNGSSRQPRAITFDSGKAYVCSYDGTVARIDTASLEIDGVAEVGRNPEDLCVQDGKLYVSNSGGLDWAGVGVDRTVSVVDLSTFAETKKIEVGPNPGKILAGPNHSVWVATQGEQIEQGDYKLVKINSQSDVVEKVYDEPVMDFAFDYNIAYLYNYDYSTGQTAFKVFDLTSGTVLRSQFITDGTNIERPFSIQVNPYSSNVYITEAYNYQVDGDLLCFTSEGTLMFRLSGVGLNPNTVLFRDEAAGVDTPGYSNLSAITGKGKDGSVYLTVALSNPTKLTNLQTGTYQFKGAYITNTTYAYLAVKDGNDGGVSVVKGPFEDGDYFTVTAIGHAASGEEVGRSTFYLADYRDGKSSVVNTWEWFDWTPLANAAYVTFEMESTDTGDYGMNTPNYFCLDGITLVEK